MRGAGVPILAGALGASVAISAGLTLLLARGLALEATHPALVAIILALFALTTTLLALSAIVALAGSVPARVTSAPTSPEPGPCAALWLICGEAPEPLAARLQEFLAGLARTGQAGTGQAGTGQGGSCDVFVLSDTQGPDARAREMAALAPLQGQITYRNRARPEGRKPGNLQDWIGQYGPRYEAFLLLDADSGFCAARLRAMRAQMAANPGLGVLQAAIRLRPAASRFGALQRLSGRLSGPVFARGLARLCGESGNFWGHNALIRTRAFAQVTPLPDLPGRAPFGGPVLSHDFIEAAFLRRAGWGVALCPDSRGSFEETPETITAHLRRDRRWAQGNLQHLALIAARGLHPASRLHLATGILAYLSAPIWLGLVLLTGSGAVHATGGVIWPLLGVLALLLVPKLAGLLARPAALLRPARRRVLLRAVWAELGLSTLFAPLGMLRRSGFVASVLAGRSVAWVPSGQAVAGLAHPGRAERLGGALIIATVALPQWLIAGPAPALLAGVLVLPVALPLLAGPKLWRWFEAPAPRPRSGVAHYYDASTRRFLALGGSGAALAIHRQLWADGVYNPAQAAAHVNAVIAAQALAALGRPPARVVDLGCGVGGTLFHLAREWPTASLCGITISAEQVRLAETHARAQGLEARCNFLRSDFTLPMTLPRADLVVAVESHVHAPNAGVFLQAALRHLAPGGVLVLVDDMLARPEADLPPAQAQRLAQFRRGWRLGHVPDRAGLVDQAQALGFGLAQVQDLTPLLRLDRWRDRALRLAGPLADGLGLAHIPVFGNMIGGNALTQSYRAGEMRYTCLVLRAPDMASTAPDDRATPREAVA
ncbi:MAG: glucans biosynthesis glucosyltransferase MdoH [Roseinatronobacter sp.]|nr:glucans biosynthesis glucosyltransferase MdoH [Roseinatronobacter sp.]